MLSSSQLLRKELLMRLASVAGRATLVKIGPDAGVRGVDVHKASAGRHGPGLASVYRDWDRFRLWAAAVPLEEAAPVDRTALGNPAGSPAQVFAIGMNYAQHSAEAGIESADRDVVPPTFTKFGSSLSGPFSGLTLPSGSVDWEVELVVVIGRQTAGVAAPDAWPYIAGLAVGQDYSERVVQMSGPVPQFCLGKSYPGFGPIGPWLTTPDELADPSDLELICEINGEQVQKGRTSAMLWPVPELVASLSAVCPLLPGDVIFTGTPAGVGFARTPPRFLAEGDVVVSRIEGLGEIRQVCRGKLNGVAS
jgi:2,4-didehydro-3-deoxy-L-rhamnonate hydrolase